MLLRFSAVMVTACLLAAVARPAAAAAPETVQADEKTLQEASLPTDGPALLEFFRGRTLVDADRNEIQDLIRQMGDDSFQVREDAFAKLVSRGPAALPLLQQARNDPDIEIVRRAERILQLIEKKYSAAIAAAAARLLAARRPEGTSEVLLAYLPFADDEAVIEEVRAALTATGLKSGQPDKALLAALDDQVPIRRALAAEVLVRAGTDEQRAAMHRLLKDNDPSVRLRVAMALVERKEKAAVPVLISLLADAPRDGCWRAEDVLYRLAGEQAPQVTLGSTDASRRKARDAWQQWWDKNGAGIDLAKLDQAPPQLGYTLLVEMIQGTNGRIREIGKDGKERWEISRDLQYPVDARVIGPDRVLVCEYNPQRRVTERNFKGEILWKKDLTAANSRPLGAQRLPNGSTFICTMNQLIEVDRAGKESVIHTRPGSDIATAVKLRDGQCVFVTRTGQCIRLDATGKEVKTFPVGPVQSLGANIEALPNGRVLVPQYANNKVVEYDRDGKSVWEVAVPQPTSVARLSNGNTLIGSMNNQQIIEVDRNGKQVNQSRSDGRLMRVRQR